jgi:hypothetical protein
MLPSGLRRSDLAEIAGHVLRGVEFLAFARSDEEIFAVGREGEAVRIMALSDDLRILLPDDLEPLERRRGALFQLRLADDRAIGIADAGLGPAQIDGAAGAKSGATMTSPKPP